MTCFWDSVIRGTHWVSCSGDRSPASFIKFLKSNNRITDNVVVNQQFLRDQEKQENIEAIKQLELENGYLCSTSDPVLCLVSNLININIRHDLNGTATLYVNEKLPNAKWLHLSSSSSHCTLTKAI